MFQKGQDLHEGRLALLIRAGHNNLRFSMFTELSIMSLNAKFGKLVCYLAVKWDAQWQPRHLICVLQKMKILEINDPHLID